jgi:hypothetical protein
MDRRKFVKSAALSGSLISSALPLKHAPMANKSGKKEQWYELRTYSFANDTQRQLTETYLEQACLPALNRAGSTPTGVFLEKQDKGRLFLLIPFVSIEAFAKLHEQLANDPVYLKTGEPYLSAPPASPAYERIESSLLKAFAHMPVLDVPAKKERIFELRCYESPTESAGQKKISMFNDAGEIDIFKKIGARPVFFGETIIGEHRPNLIYMLCFDDMQAHDVHWKAFGSDPDWKKISGMPEYSDALLISKITRTFLVPTSYSQI